MHLSKIKKVKTQTIYYKVDNHIKNYMITNFKFTIMWIPIKITGFRI